MSTSTVPTLTLTRRDGLEYAELPRLSLTLRVPGAPDRVAELGLTPVTVGAGAGSTLVAEDASVSRRHCEVALTEGGVLIRDLGSKNGTVINGVPVREASFLPGSCARLGNAQLQLVQRAGIQQIALAQAARFGDAVGGSLIMRALFDRLRRAAVTDESLLLLGETGTGKEVLARAIHSHSRRSDGPFVILDCGSLPPSLVEAELFGYEKGAFTGATSARVGLLEQAHGGTLFLDEIGELPLELQPRLLRALESRQVRPLGSGEWRAADARVVAATHRTLSGSDGAFRADLYFRISVLEVEVPPLRERKEDIPMLVERFLAALQPPATLAELPTGALELFAAYSWPGNVRELRNTALRLKLFPELGAGALGSPRTPSAVGGLLDGRLHRPLREAREDLVEQFERAYVEAKLRSEGGVVAAACAMGVSRQFLHRLMVRYGIRATHE